MKPTSHHAHSEQHCSTSHLFRLNDEDENQLGHLDALFNEIELRAGDQVFENGQTPRHLYLVKRGLIKLHQLQMDGEQRIIRVVRQGEVLGLRGILKEPYRYDASAMVPSVVCQIRLDELMKICTYHPKIRQRVYWHWQQAIDRSSSWLVDLSTGPSKTRMAHLLLKLAAPGSNRICYLPTRQEMAAMLGLQSETVSRIYSEFMRAGYITKLPPRRAALDLEALRQVTDNRK